MNKLILFFFCFLLSVASFCKKGDEEKIKFRKLTYADFTKIAINDTSMVVIDLFFNKKENARDNQMVFLPVTVALVLIPPAQILGIGTTMISLPLFINGVYTKVKYRKKKLYYVLTEYKETRTLPKKVREKANKLLKHYETIQSGY